MTHITQMLLRLAATTIMLIVYTQAQGGMAQIDLPHLEWRNYISSVDGKNIFYHFPVDTRPTTRFNFNPSPKPDLYTKSIGLIGMQVGLDVGWRKVSAAYTLALALSPEAPELRRARTINQLRIAIDQRYQQALKPASGMVSRLETLKIINFGGRDWVWVRYVDKQGGLPASDDYYALWDADYLLRFHVRYGTKLNADSEAVDRIRQLGEEVISSLRVEER